MFAKVCLTHFSRPNRMFLIALIVALSLGLFALPMASASAATCGQSYTVQPGDNLYRIGLKFGVAWPRLAEANNLANPRLIFPGQVLCLPEVGATPAPTTTPAPTSQAPSTATSTPQTGTIPAITIVSVTPGLTVTIQTANFPSHQTFDVRMGKNGTLGVNGTLVTTQDSGQGGSFTATYAIPASLKNERVIAIRLESSSGYYSYGWFSNQSTR